MVKAPDRMTLFDGEGNRDGSGDGVRSFRRRFPGEVGRDRREREGVVGSTGIMGGSVLCSFAGLCLVCMGVFRFEANGWRGLLGVMISTASMIILGLTGVVGLGGTARGAGSSFSSVSSSSTTVGTFFFVVRDRVGLVVDFEGPAVVVRLVVRVDVLEGGLVGGGLVAGFLDGGFARATCSSTSVGRTLGGLPRRLGATTVSIASSISVTVAFFVTRFDGAFSVLDDPGTALVRVVGCFLVGSGGSKALDSCSVFVARRVARAVVRGLRGGFAGVTGPSDRSLRREGSDGRGSAGAFRLGAIVVRIRQQKGSSVIELLVTQNGFPCRSVRP